MKGMIESKRCLEEPKQHSALRTMTCPSQLDPTSKYALHPGLTLLHKDLILREEETSPSTLEDGVGSAEPIGRVLEYARRPTSTDANDLRSGAQATRPSQCGKLRNRLLLRVLDKMKSDLATDLDLRTLAAESGYSRSHFLRTFRAAMGCSPHQCLTQLRVEQAKTLLRGNSISLIEIALDCGFSSHAHFSNTFRQIAGVTPSEYRRIHGPIVKKRLLFASDSFEHSLSSG
jgi:AraC-like DNA-binding protein